MCQTQEEIDHYWNKLSEGGDKNARQCGWLKDKYGLSWQVVPTVLAEMMSNPDKEKAGRAMEALLQMKKLDIAGLQRAFEGETAASRR
jgi:predicted 3-demethylubiquinone-9 3-methyltransferase (glyoxalase superfamily)